jgi:hypothetical protein
MQVALLILDLLIVLTVVISVSRAVWVAASSRALALVIIAAMIIFGLVSLSAANGLTAASSFNQWALLIFLVAIAVTARLSWQKPGASAPLMEKSAR